MMTVAQKNPSGYKQTEIGMIPVDWDVKRLDDIFSISAGRDLVKDSFSQIKDDNHTFPIYSNSLQNDGLYGYTESARHNGNSITITARGMIGKANARNHKFDAIGRVLALEPIKDLDIFYVSEYLNNRVKFSVESTGVPQLTAPQASKYLIAYPAPKEQCAIAKALFDDDVLIKKLEKLIEKKRNIKQGVMQELLTGKRRLSGFNGKLEIKKISDVCKNITTGKLNANAMVEGGEYRFYTCAKDYYQIDRFAFDTEALLVSGNGANVGYVHYYKGKFNAYQRTYVLSDFSADIYFIKLFMDRNLQERIRVEVNAGNTPYITMGTLTEMQIMIPPTKYEQTAIANILLDMDTEIEKLESQLIKYQNIKQGMMQTLLTGKIRLTSQ